MQTTAPDRRFGQLWHELRATCAERPQTRLLLLSVVFTWIVAGIMGWPLLLSLLVSLGR